MSIPAAALDFGQYTTLRADARRGDDAALGEAARQFEAILVRSLLRNARNVSFGDDGLGAHGDVIRDLRDNQLADHIVAGRGLGLAELLVRQLGGQPAAPPSSGYATSSLSRPPKAAHAQLRAIAAEPTGFEQPADFVQALKPHAERAAAELGISPRILLAQAALESNWGRQMPQDDAGNSSRNLFGIKAGSQWEGKVAAALTTEYRDAAPEREVAGFRAYDSYADSFGDYVRLLKSSSRYAPALDHAGDDKKFLSGLKSAGYATDPRYVEKVQGVAQSPLFDDVI